MNDSILRKKMRKALRKPILGYGLLTILIMVSIIGLKESIVDAMMSLSSQGLDIGRIVQVIAFIFLFIIMIALLVYTFKCINIYLGMIEHKDIRRISEGGELQRTENEINEKLRNNILYEDKHMTLINAWIIGTSMGFFIRRLEDIISVDSYYSANSIYYVRIKYGDNTLNTIKLYGKYKAENLEKQIRACVDIGDI